MHSLRKKCIRQLHSPLNGGFSRADYTNLVLHCDAPTWPESTAPFG